MRSIELTFDDDGDRAVRAAWQALVDTDLPSLGRHDAPSNAPHVTLVAGEALPVPAGLPPAPARIRLGGTLLFPAGPGRVVLARQVVVSEQLLAFQRAVHDAAPEVVPTSLPGAWTPHVTLARRIRIADLPAALAAVGEVEVPEELVVAGVRHWAGDTTTLTQLG